MTRDAPEPESLSSKALRTLSLSALAGAAAIAVYSFQAASRSELFSVLGLGLLIAGASLLLGGGLGFLFGIPRTLQSESSSNDPSKAANAVDYRANTNLEQISDWLTKMLVGVGLTQLTSMPAYLQSTTQYLAGGLGNRPSDSVLALSLILYFSVVGFLFGYLWTRLYLAGAFRQADLETIGVLVNRVDQTDKKIEQADKKIEQADKKIEQFNKQPALDAEALNLTYRQLSLTSEGPEISQEKLNAAVAAAASPIKVQIFNQAWQVRSDNWKNNKPLMERTIPVFRALIACDPEGRYHMNHGQLGFALKDQREPDWAEAEKELTTAIEIRGSWQENGWLFYEFNRALCRIKRDQAFARGKPSDPSSRDAILDDLRAASHSDLRQLIRDERPIAQWMKLNKVTLTDLRKEG